MSPYCCIHNHNPLKILGLRSKRTKAAHRQCDDSVLAILLFLALLYNHKLYVIRYVEEDDPTTWWTGFSHLFPQAKMPPIYVCYIIFLISTNSCLFVYDIQFIVPHLLSPNFVYVLAGAVVLGLNHTPSSDGGWTHALEGQSRFIQQCQCMHNRF